MMDLSRLDIELLVDKSASMGFNKDCPGGKSRWVYGQETIMGIAAYAEKYDDDGITVVPFSNNFKVYEGVTSSKVAQIFAENQPNGGTDTAKVLQDRLNSYFARKANGNTKPVCLFCFTDGEPNDRQAVADVIVAATQRMDRDEEIAISFIQVGRDQEAANFLQWLDDGLVAAGAKYDIVDRVMVDEVENFTIEQLIEKAFTD